MLTEITDVMTNQDDLKVVSVKYYSVKMWPLTDFFFNFYIHSCQSWSGGSDVLAHTAKNLICAEHLQIALPSAAKGTDYINATQWLSHNWVKS